MSAATLHDTVQLELAVARCYTSTVGSPLPGRAVYRYLIDVPAVARAIDRELAANPCGMKPKPLFTVDEDERGQLECVERNANGLPWDAIRHAIYAFKHGRRVR